MRSRGSPTTGCVVALLASLGLLAHPAFATDIQLTLGSLPSAQGWIYNSGGIAAPESPTWALSIGLLTFDTMAFGFGASGTGTTSYYSRTGIVNSVDPVIIELRGRVLEFEGDGSALEGDAFSFGFTQGTTHWALQITPAEVRNANGAVLSTAFDNTHFHDYRLEWTPPSTIRYYVENTLVSTDNAGAAASSNDITFGDLTESANAHAQITRYRFQQTAMTPVRASSWGRTKLLYR